MTSRDKLESLFKSSKPTVEPALPAPSPEEIEPIQETVIPSKTVSVKVKREPPLRPCGCRSWFNNEICPYCGKRILKGVLPKPSI